ncbi:mitochondrial chaperone Frataxin [Xylaria sp. CBS 124048]|nr:mitochondrial chaperone Frataxin [Xylaria sp. CBS 124048]
MARVSVARLARLTVRGIATRSAATMVPRQLVASRHQILPVQPTFRSLFSTSQSLARLGAQDLKSAHPADITEAQFHELADDCIDDLLAKYEKMQDARTDIDVEYSAGVMTLKIDHIGTYVINKQPPNKQIWLSSPVSGPKRYDWVVIREGQDQKQDSASANWIYLRDGSSLGELLRRETGVDIESPK